MDFMKRVASSIILCLILTTGFSQIKVWEDNRVSIATLGRSYGVQILPNAVVGFHPQVYADWAWMNLTYAPREKSKCWIVSSTSNPGRHTFFVTGGGICYNSGLVSMTDENYMDLTDNFSENDSTGGISNALSMVCRLRGVLFYWKNDSIFNDSLNGINYVDTTYIDPEIISEIQQEDSLAHIGVIAQEVERVIPELVRTAPDGRKGVEYYSLAGLLIEAVKDQQEIINQLRVDIEMQKVEFLKFQEAFSERNEQVKETKTNVNEEMADGIIGTKKTVSLNSNERNILFQNSPNPFSLTTLYNTP